MIAIHDGAGWNAAWLEYCRAHEVPHVRVDAYASDIIERLRGCDAFLWHFHHNRPADLLVARHVLSAAELMGLRVFPDHHTSWHFDDKVAQKYLFEAAELPAVQAWAFFDRDTALDFVAKCELPVVAKLRRGAGSHNVRLLRTRAEARAYVRRMFGRGYPPAMGLLTDVRRKVRTAAPGGWRGLLRRARRIGSYARVVTAGRRYLPVEKGYVYIQRFLAGNDCDIRVSVVGERAWAFRRMVRPGDFRASGSGVIDYDTAAIPSELITESFAAAQAMKTQSVCLDWVHDPQTGAHRFVEVSYGFQDDAVYGAPGYWDRRLTWHAGHTSPSIAVLEDVLAACELDRTGPMNRAGA